MPHKSIKLIMKLIPSCADVAHVRAREFLLHKSGCLPAENLYKFKGSIIYKICSVA